MWTSFEPGNIISSSHSINKMYTNEEARWWKPGSFDKANNSRQFQLIWKQSQCPTPKKKIDKPIIPNAIIIYSCPICYNHNDHSLHTKLGNYMTQYNTVMYVTNMTDQAIRRMEIQTNQTQPNLGEARGVHSHTMAVVLRVDAGAKQTNTDVLVAVDIRFWKLFKWQKNRRKLANEVQDKEKHSDLVYFIFFFLSCNWKRQVWTIVTQESPFRTLRFWKGPRDYLYLKFAPSYK